MAGTAFYLALLAVLSALTLRKPHIALVAVLCMFGLEQLGQVYVPYLRTNNQFTNLYILGLVGIGGGILFFTGKLPLSRLYAGGHVRLLCAVLYVFAFVSLLWSPVDGWEQWNGKWPYMFAYIVIAPLLLVKPDDAGEVQRVFIWLGGALVAFLAFVPDWGARSLVVADSGEEMGLPLALAQVSGYLLITASLHLTRNVVSIGWLVCVVVSALVVAIKTGSRGQLIFSIVALLLVLPMVWRRFALRHAIQLIATAAVIVTVTVYIFQLTDSYSGRWEAARMFGDFFNRFAMAKTLLTEWFGSPVAILIGLGSSASFSPDIIGRYPHIVPLEILGEEGAIGFALFVAIVVLSLRQAIRIKKLDFLHQDAKRVYASFFGCFLFTLLISLKQGSLLNSSVIFLFAVCSERYYTLVRQQLFIESGRPASEKRRRELPHGQPGTAH